MSYLGLGASSKLFQEIREKRGLVYNIYAYNQSLSDVGAFSVFAGTSRQNLEEVVKIILEEFRNMKHGLEKETLEKVKHKTIGLYILGSENNRQRMQHLGISTLRNNNPRSVEEVVNTIEEVSNEDLYRAANNIFNENKISFTILGISETKAKDIEALIN
jgi:predicted Zn-dependent peptidase